MRQPRTAQRTLRGFSLVELMIAIVLGLLVTDAIISMFVGVRSASRMSSGVAALSDSGRYALDTIEENVRASGHLACNSTEPVQVAGTPLIRQISLLNAGASPLVSDFAEPVAGYEAVGTGPGGAVALANAPAADNNRGDWVTTNALGNTLDPLLINPPLPAGEAAPVGKMIQGSDVLVVRETLSGTPPSYTTNPATGAGAFTISSSSAFAAAGGQIGVISNCVQSEVFQVATFNPGAGTGVVSLTGAAVAPGNSAGTLSGNIAFSVGSQVVPADTIVFYIGVGADGDGALFRWESNGGVLGDGYSVNEELVPDVENMQILYGVATALSANTESAAQYVTADQVANQSTTHDFNGVISVRVALLVASPLTATQGTPAAAASPPALLGTDWALAAPDARMRQMYEQTIFLRNMSP
jgi:type IV pilus assembly protein PilW